MAGEEAKYVFLYSEADKDKNKQNVKSKEYVVLKRRTSKDGFIDTEKEDQNVVQLLVVTCTSIKSWI